MKDKVYLIVEDWSCDGEHVVDFQIFDDKRTALKRIKQEIRQAKVDNSFGILDIDMNKDNPSYEGYSEGFFNNDHLLIYLKEKEIIKEKNRDIDSR